ncbi:M48 family metalloprotease [Sphingobacterium sp. DK4209]|uniref:M48 family metalloprotease n=2 Tax=Sphingobacterium zhuxiongii TaxID=2662364 RepID=A0A5Q0Q4X2_9SPHI|nr:M48 family metalloprotease [Sphingobacterium sp. DK4209]QGA25077.1 M48 family metalloprotease [Sphingobacterium sp. dk4302]
MCVGSCLGTSLITCLEMKIIGKLLLLVLSIGILYLGLSQINWSRIFEVDEKQEKLEKRLGKLVLDDLESSMSLIKNDSINRIVDSIFHPLLAKNGISRKGYKVLVLQDAQVNAFALPDKQIVLTTIINFLDSANYVSAILAHELAHCEKKHVMKSLITKFGLDLLLSGSGASNMTNFLTGQAFSRNLEREADEQAVVYLNKAKVNPHSLTHVMELFDVYLTGDLDLTWASTHPSPSDRKEYIEEKIGEIDLSMSFNSPIQQATWKRFKELVKAYDSEEDQD